MVLAIIGILLLLAVPQFSKVVSRTKSQEAQLQLKNISNMQTQYQFLNSQYSMDFEAIDVEPPLTIKQGGTANYQYEIIQADNAGFKARAEAIVDFDGDGVFNVWEIDEKGRPTEIVKD